MARTSAGASADAGANADGDELLFEVTGNIGRVTFNRPAARNALTFGMYERLACICASVPEDGSLKAIIITGGKARAFASGTDISLFRDFTSGADGLGYEAKMEDVLARIEACRVPTIAAISGACTGGGAMIAAICDLRIASADMKFGFPIARTLGNCLSPENLTRLAALIGVGRVKDLIFTARLMGADEALATGLVSEVLDDGDALQARASELAAQVAQMAPLTLSATKQMLTRLRKGTVAGGEAIDGADLIAECYASADFREGVEAFLAKRRPNWKGR